MQRSQAELGNEIIQRDCAAAYFLACLRAAAARRLAERMLHLYADVQRVYQDTYDHLARIYSWRASQPGMAQIDANSPLRSRCSDGYFGPCAGISRIAPAYDIHSRKTIFRGNFCASRMLSPHPLTILDGLVRLIGRLSVVAHAV